MRIVFAMSEAYILVSLGIRVASSYAVLLARRLAGKPNQNFVYMDIRKHFEYNPVLVLTAANIGISKWDWVSIDSEDEGRAKEIMGSKKFDVLPIVGPDNQANKFFSTAVWNQYDRLNCTSINTDNKIYYRLSFNDLVSKFNEQESHFYFLTNRKEVLGLVSYINLNCQAVYNYLYQILADLEKSTSDALRECLSEERVLNMLKKSSDPIQNKIAEKFEIAIKQGVETSIFHFFYLQTIGIMLKKFEDEIQFSFPSLNTYQSKFLADGTYGQLRNKIMHPVRPILSDQSTIAQMDDLLTDYTAIKEILSKRGN